MSWNSIPPEKLAAARSLIEQGVGRNEISRTLGVSIDWLRKTFGRIQEPRSAVPPEVKAEMQAMRAKNFSYAAIASRFGVSYWVAEKWCCFVPCERPHAQPVTLFEVARMRKLRGEGKTISQTARILGRSHTAVAQNTRDLPYPSLSKLPPAPILEAMLAQGRTKADIGREFGVDPGAIKKRIQRAKRQRAA